MAGVPGVLRKWNPGIVPGLKLWIDGSDTSTLIFSNQSNISQIVDKSGIPGQNIVQNTLSNQPRIASNINNNQTIRFDSNVFMSSITKSFPESINNLQSSYFLVNSLRNPAALTLQYIASLVSSNTSNSVNIVNTPLIIKYQEIFQGGGGVNNNIIPVSYSNTSNFIIEAYNTTNNTLYLVNCNIVGVNPNKYTGNATPLQSNLTTLYIGSSGIGTGLGTNLIGDIGEYLAFNSNYYGNNRYTPQLEGYLAWKWGLTSFLSNGHPYKNRAPT